MDEYKLAAKRLVAEPVAWVGNAMGNVTMSAGTGNASYMTASAVAR